jgi:drug/metabolite transporter (DMT)-like permease
LPTPLPRLAGALLLLLIATTFASNHIAARLAFDHGTSVATAVAVRSITTVLVVSGLLISTGTPMRLPFATLKRVLVIGLLLSVQSYCLYAAVARLPVALALLTFNIFPILLAGVAWLAGGQRPGRRTLIAMPVILVGLTLALNVLGLGTPAQSDAVAGQSASDWKAMSAGLLAGALGMVHDAAGQPTSAFTWPDAPIGWLGLALLSILYTIAFTTLFALLPRLGAVNNAPILNFEPIAALILGAQILGQKVLPVQIGGALLVIGAIVFLTTGRRS